MSIYKMILRRRAARWRTAPGAAVPTVCVGNVTVGGTGKTPHTEMIIRLLESNAPDGVAGAPRIAVLSRGYKRSSKGFQLVQADSTASFAGDEPLQIKRKFPAVAVAVDKDRVRGCEMIAGAEGLRLATATHEPAQKTSPEASRTVIILDDAFQYNRLRASLNLVLVDWNRPVWSDRLLPFGRLRDLPERLADADAVIVTKCPRYAEDEELEAVREKVRAYRSDLPVFFTYIEYEDPKPVFAETDPHYSYAQSCVLFTGIANDRPLQAYLSDRYKVAGHIGFADHHKFSRSDIRRIATLASRYPTAMIATTEKDAQRIRDCAFVPDIIRTRLFEVPIRAEFLSPEGQDAFLQLLTKTIF